MQETKLHPLASSVGIEQNGHNTIVPAKSPDLIYSSVILSSLYILIFKHIIVNV
jgi:hypothetical protein